MGVPGSDDIMLGYQSTSFHDALAMRRLLGLQPSPEFEAWLQRMGIFQADAPRLADGGLPARFAALLESPS
jgi:ethanolamine ammonia-lyase large subunit